MEIYINKSMRERAARAREQRELAELAKEYSTAEKCATIALWAMALALAATMVYMFVTR